MFTIIFCWLVISVVIIFIGRLFLQKAEWYEYFWMGLAVTFAILQIWSIFLPVNFYALIAVLALGASSFLVFRKIKFPKIKIIKDWVIENRIFISVTCLGLIVISYYASQPVGWDDTLLYHLNAVKWGKLYSVVPGLANLHTRLGFNSSFFLFASMLDSWFMTDRSSHLAPSILAAVLSIEYLWILLKSSDRGLKLFCLFTIPLLLYSIAYREIIASLSPDFILTIVILALAIEFTRKEKSSVITAIFLSVLLVTIKFTAVAFSAIVLVIIIVMNRDKWKWIISSGIFLVVAYLIRNIYLSGWLLYPLPFFKLNVDWAMPTGQVNGLYTVIQAWAKSPNAEWTKFIDTPFWQWFPMWYQNNQNSMEIKMFVLGLVVILILLLTKNFNKFFFQTYKNIILLNMVSFVSVIYVFCTAPDIRFGEVFIWVFFASAISTYLLTLKWNLNVKMFTILGSLIFSLLISWPPRLDNEPILRSVRWDQAWPTENVNGILIPLKQDFCGNSSLPCTPEANKIKWRVSGDVSKGFAPIY